MSNKHSLVGGALSAVLVSVCFVTQAHAGDHGYGWDYKSSPGAACQPQSGAQGANFDRYTQSILNVGKLESTLICPIVRDSMSPADLDVGVVLTKGVRCVLESMDSHGNIIASISPTSVESVDVDREVQYFSIVPKESTAQDGAYALQCTLPGSAELFSYRWGERVDSTDYGN